MSVQDIETKAYEEKIGAELQQAKAQLAEFEGRAKGKKAQMEIDAIHRLKTKHQEIEKKSHELKTLGEAKAGQAKAEMDAEITKLKTSLAEIGAKLKG